MHQVYNYQNLILKYIFLYLSFLFHFRTLTLNFIGIQAGTSVKTMNLPYVRKAMHEDLNKHKYLLISFIHTNQE